MTTATITRVLLASAHVPSVVTYLFGAILVLMIITLAMEEKIHAKKSIITGVFAVVCLFAATVFELLPVDPATGKAPLIDFFRETLDLPVYIPGIDWGVICIILGSSIFVDVISRSGLFTWIAIKLTKASRGDPLLLLIYYGLMTVLFSALLNNVTAMLIIGSLTVVSLRKLKRSQLLLGFLLIEGLLTNIGGLLTLISSVPNIIVGNAAGIAFIEFTEVAGAYVLIATVVTIALGARKFGVKRLSSKDERELAKQMVSSFDENDGIESRSFFWTGAGLFVLFILALATTSVIPFVKELGMGYVAMAFAFLALLKFKSSADRFYKALDWDLLLFFASLFVVINVMEHAQVLAMIGHVLEEYVLQIDAAAPALLASSAATSSVTDNIPLAAMMAKILGSLPIEKQTMDLWWSVVFGANLGGNITPIGSASTVVAVTIMHKHEVGVSFGRFVKLALPFVLVQIAIAILYVVLFV